VLRSEPKQPPPCEWQPGPGRLTLEEREEISVGLGRGESYTAIAGRLGRSFRATGPLPGSPVGRHREIPATAAVGRDLARHRRHRARLACPRLACQVEEWVEQWWSPEEISQRLPIEFPDDPMMWVSHETIYQSLFVQGRGELRRELTRCLRTGRSRRRPQRRVPAQRRLPGMVMISQRPAEADDRAVPGHWEDHVIPARSQPSMRHTRMPDGSPVY